VPDMRKRGVEIQVVERWVDTVDEMFRFRPDALFIDVDHPEFELIHRTISEQNPSMPLIFTGTVSSTAPAVARLSPWVIRPYDPDELERLAKQAMARPKDLAPREAPAPQPKQATVAKRDEIAATPATAERKPTNDEYEVVCFTCRVEFNAIDADWCSCLTRERTIVCTNCLTCFCKASAAYKEKFWINAPPRLFERKNVEAQKQQQSLPENAPMTHVKRPLVLCVDDDAQIQAIVAKICSNLGYGAILAADGQAGLALAREYKPNLILSDAFMPKLDGREMCRILKEEPLGENCKMVVMTGLYTDTKYRSEAVKRFHIDDYIAKPVAVTDLINLLQKHLEGVAGLPVEEGGLIGGSGIEDDEEDALPTAEEVQEEEPAEDVPLAKILTMPGADSAKMQVQSPRVTSGYEVDCFNCHHRFDATSAEWCHCVGRDNTLVCPKCNGCFCKAPASYKERFWIDAPPSLFERKMIGSKRSLGSRSNPAPAEVKRPLILLVEDDENVQLIVRTVVTNMGYGFVVGTNGQEGLLLAREYGPDLILSDAFMPKLDGREMCRLLKEDPRTAQSKAIIMTGLYTDRKYRNEALSYFKVDDYVAKPLAVDDLIKLFKKHLPQAVSAANNA
ncbi:MAG TPA: response regulator, partial [Thermoanaerobaculia bacterium]|nr:response regulator [Thermoanaerobaculia bacterium]